ncbi:unnamed protein product [Cercospora beticola]|nr:unnamed protein product [Cercospora beticola]
MGTISTVTSSSHRRYEAINEKSFSRRRRSIEICMNCHRDVSCLLPYSAHPLRPRFQMGVTLLCWNLTSIVVVRQTHFQPHLVRDFPHDEAECNKAYGRTT